MLTIPAVIQLADSMGRDDSQKDEGGYGGNH